MDVQQHVPAGPPPKVVAKKKLVGEGAAKGTTGAVPKKALHVVKDETDGAARRMVQHGLDARAAAKGINGGKPSVSTVLPQGKVKDMVSGAEKGAKIGGGWGAAAGAAAGSGALGQTGVSLARGEVPDAQAVQKDLADAPKKAAKVAAGAGAVASGPAVANAMAMAAFLNWLKSMVFSGIAAALNLGKLLASVVGGAAKALVSKVVGFFAGIGHGVASTLGLGAAAANVTAVGAGVMSVAMVATLVGAGITAGGNGRWDAAARAQDCAAPLAAAAVAGSGTTASASELANAKAVYGALKAVGMPDENIAGILGNWTQESRIDPTSVQGIFDEPYTYGPRKQAAIASGSTSYGLGLGQWTGARNTMLLNYASSKGKDWYDPALQLAFMMSGDNPGDVAVFKTMMTTSQGTPAQAANYFHSQWERSADGAAGIAAREAAAQNWYGQMSGWDATANPLGSAINSMVTIAGAAVSSAVSVLTNSCPGPTGQVALSSGGLTKDQAQQLINLYISEGDAFLDARYGNYGGPGSCGDDHAMNCVSFSVYFLNKYTSFQKYPPGNGKDTVSSVAAMTGKPTSTTPKAYSIASGDPSNNGTGHTFVVLGMTATSMIIGQADYCKSDGSVAEIPLDRATNGTWTYVDVSDLITDPTMAKA